MRQFPTDGFPHEAVVKLPYGLVNLIPETLHHSMPTGKCTFIICVPQNLHVFRIATDVQDNGMHP